MSYKLTFWTKTLMFLKDFFKCGKIKWCVATAESCRIYTVFFSAQWKTMAFFFYTRVLGKRNENLDNIFKGFCFLEKESGFLAKKTYGTLCHCLFVSISIFFKGAAFFAFLKCQSATSFCDLAQTDNRSQIYCTAMKRGFSIKLQLMTTSKIGPRVINFVLI